MHRRQQPHQGLLVPGACQFAEGPAERLILNAGPGRHARRIGRQKGKGTFLAATVLGQVKTDPPDLVPQGCPPLQETGQPFTAGRNRVAYPGIQIIPNGNEDRLVEILGAVHRRDTQDQRRQFGRRGRCDRLQFQAGDLGRVTEGRQVANGELPPIGKRRRKRTGQPLGRQQEQPVALTDPKGLGHSAQLSIRLHSPPTRRRAVGRVCDLTHRDSTGRSQR